MTPGEGWRFFTDQVMGGVSVGELVFATEDGVSFARMTGMVSTANRGGFIQMRRDLPQPPAETCTGLRLMVRGTGTGCFVHLRTTRAQRPWHYHRARFAVTASWAELWLPFADFVASDGMQGAALRPGELISIGIVAAGYDHRALIDVARAEIG